MSFTIKSLVNKINITDQNLPDSQSVHFKGLLVARMASGHIQHLSSVFPHPLESAFLTLLSVLYFIHMYAHVHILWAGFHI